MGVAARVCDVLERDAVSLLTLVGALVSARRACASGPLPIFSHTMPVASCSLSRGKGLVASAWAFGTMACEAQPEG